MQYLFFLIKRNVKINIDDVVGAEVEWEGGWNSSCYHITNVISIHKIMNKCYEL